MIFSTFSWDIPWIWILEKNIGVCLKFAQLDDITTDCIAFLKIFSYTSMQNVIKRGSMKLPTKSVPSGCRNFLDSEIDYPMWKSIQSCPSPPSLIDPERSFLVNHCLDIFEGHWASWKKRYWYFDVFKSKTWSMLALCYAIRKSGACSTKPLIQNLPPSRFVRLV